MTVILKNGFLKQQQSAALTDTGRVVKVLVVNLMPNKLETERQFAELFSQLTVNVQVTFAWMASHHSKHISEADFAKADYATLPDLQNSYFDGLVVTGAPVEEMAFEDVDYWSEFKDFLDWRETHVRESIFECWAAQAGLYADFDIQKQVLPSKLFGVYRCQINAQTSLTAGFDNLSMPQSRHSTLTAIDDPEVDVLASDPEAGPVVMHAVKTRSTYISGHPEYETNTLFNEFHRDMGKGLPIRLPKRYFSAAEPANTWRGDSVQLYNNWVASLKRVESRV
ncbi:homoserine O-acetyltransferase/O-succinyltransferase family protein [Secundilactobacillus collinoides]|uniref:Homoserine O-acetyltransferase n=2 Tax=Secundilactobacillus collinoides TaxID=33960 RepID=A0A0R2BFX0_SECCO|nr:homoserine O-succinyltransferase [Secundilactobacillus collinoides]KRM77994.1 homoserine O-succinyltransferase [Secundilactobacillus collinoides DSM 20515 = JCM 1123]KZL40076.1 hypothetical protein TY91_09205 [Secundilactobacillus collinoides]